MYLRPVIAWSDIAIRAAAFLLPIALFALLCWWGRATPEQDARVVQRVMEAR